MKNLTKLSVMVFAVAAFAFTSCDSKKAENAESAVEETVDAAESKVEDATTATEGDTATLRDEPVKDGLVDTTATK